MALLLVLNLAFMAATLASAMLQSGTLATSGALAAVEHIRAFHAADGAMVLCERRVLAARSRNDEIAEGPLPVFSRDERWPGSIRLPECTVEKTVDARGRVNGYRITATGFAATNDARSLAQTELWFTPGIVHRRWQLPGELPAPHSENQHRGVRP